MTKHTALAHIWQFISYVEERMAAPKLFDKTVMQHKLEQVKEVLRQVDADSTDKSDVRTQLKGRGQASSTNKGMARKTERRTR